MLVAKTNEDQTTSRKALLMWKNIPNYYHTCRVLKVITVKLGQCTQILWGNFHCKRNVRSSHVYPGKLTSFYKGSLKYATHSPFQILSDCCQFSEISVTVVRTRFFRYTQRNFFEILLNQTKIRLYFRFSDCFGTKRTSVWFQINRRMVTTIFFSVWFNNIPKRLNLCA